MGRAEFPDELPNGLPNGLPNEVRAGLRIEVFYCPAPGVQDLSVLQLAEGATVADALQASGLLQRHALVVDGLRLGVWGKTREASSLLRDRDRVEVYRPLLVDPKEARRLRYKRHRDKQAR